MQARLNYDANEVIVRYFTVLLEAFTNRIIGVHVSNDTINKNVLLLYKKLIESFLNSANKKQICQ